MDDEEPVSEIGEDSESFVTPDAVLKDMTTCWQNEVCAPCLLPSQSGLVETLLDQIAGMEEDISKKTDKTQLRISIHRMELQRISYITSDYLRCRLCKIEKNPNRVIEEHAKRAKDGLPDLLSKSELEFAQEYAKLEADLYSSTALETLRVGLRKLAMPEPDDKFEMVYAQVMEQDIGSVSIPDWADLTAEVVLEMEQFSIHLLPFESIKHNVENGSMRLL